VNFDISTITGGISILFFSIWNFIISAKFREISKLWTKYDEMNRELRNLEVRTIERFASKSEVREMLDRLHADIGSMREALDRLARMIAQGKNA